MSLFLWNSIIPLDINKPSFVTAFLIIKFNWDHYSLFAKFGSAGPHQSSWCWWPRGRVVFGSLLGNIMS